MRIFEGGLRRSADEAVATAARIGYPVVLKVQSAALPHKTEVGGVLVGVADEAALRTGWDELHRRVAAPRPGLDLDGLLVEAMGPPGVEMVVGGLRDPDWGPTLLFGLGGVAIEALKHVRLAPADLRKAAVVEVIVRIGALLRQHPEIEEIDMNPLIAYPAGTPPLTLDALIVVGPDGVDAARASGR